MSVRRAARGTLLTVFFRIFSFLCTQWTIRALDPIALGQTNIQLELLLTTILFWRTGVRYALTNGDASRDVGSSNVAYLTIPVSTLVSGIAFAWHWATSVDKSNDYRWAGAWYCLAACLEGWAEPAVLYSLNDMNVGLKASAEGLASVCKAAATVAALHFLTPVTAIGVSQLFYAIVYGLVLYASTFSHLPRHTRDFDKNSLYRTSLFVGQSLFQHILTQADKLVLTFASAKADLGVYAMSSAYGSLAARFMLQPLEENARLYWSNNSNNMLKLYFSYTLLVKLVLYIGLVFGCLAVNYTWIVLNVLAGRKWGGNAEAVTVLSYYCIYTGFLAWNGMTEAFVYATADSGQALRRLSIAHTVVGISLAVVAHYTVERHGAAGMVFANAIAMCLRGTYNLHVATRFFQQSSTYWRTLKALAVDVLPRRVVMVAFAVCNWLTRRSLARMMKQIDESPQHVTTWLAVRHVGIGAIGGVAILTLAWLSEKDVFYKFSKLKELEGQSSSIGSKPKSE